MNKTIYIIILSLVSLSLLALLIAQNNTLPKNGSNYSNEGAAVENIENNYEEKQDNKVKEPVLEESETSISINLSNQNLQKLPDYILSKKDLEKLDISNNNISGSLPAEIRHLQNLKTLDASNNKMTGVPAEIGQLSKLEFLDLSNNQITGLPYELGNLKNLKILNLSGNDYAKQDLEIIKNSLPGDTTIIL